MRRHELDPVSLTFGFVFAGLGLLFLLGQADQALRLRWVWPLLLFALGAGILLDITRAGRRNDPGPDPDADAGAEAATVDLGPDAPPADPGPRG
jgi:hypothetical protein